MPEGTAGQAIERGPPRVADSIVVPIEQEGGLQSPLQDSPEGFAGSSVDPVASVCQSSAATTSVIARHHQRAYSSGITRSGWAAAGGLGWCNCPDQAADHADVGTASPWRAGAGARRSAGISSGGPMPGRRLLLHRQQLPVDHAGIGLGDLGAPAVVFHRVAEDRRLEIVMREELREQSPEERLDDLRGGSGECSGGQDQHVAQVVIGLPAPRFR